MKSQTGIAFGVIGTIILNVAIVAVIFLVEGSRYRNSQENKSAAWAWEHSAGGVDPLQTQASGGVERGKELYGLVCVACHGLNGEGNRALNAPALHQQQDWYLAAQIRNFREGWRGRHPDDVTGNQMRPMVGGLPDPAAYNDLAVYITTLDAPAPTPEIAGDIRTGRDIYKTNCMPCHGEDGRGRREFKAPGLAGQGDWYVAAQLEKFSRKIRGSHPDDHAGTLMQRMSTNLSPGEARDVAAYIATLPGEASAGQVIPAEDPGSPESPASALSPDPSVVSGTAVSALAEATQIFETVCATCHGITGKGDGPAGAALPTKPRNYQDTVWQASVTDEELATIIIEGGAAVGKSPFMVASPGLRDKPEVLAEIIKIIRGFRQ